MKRKAETSDYNFKRDRPFPFLKGVIKYLLFIYIIFFIIFSFLEKGLTEISAVIPFIPVIGLFFISIFQLIWHFIFSPPEITFSKNTVCWKTNTRKQILINFSDILYVKNGISHSRFNGTYYNDKYYIFLKNGKKYKLDFFLFANKYSIDKMIMNITKIYNENSVKYIRKNTGTFFKIYNEDKYIFYTAKYKLKLLLGIAFFILFIILLIYKIFFIGMISLALSVFLLAVPVKTILNLKNRDIAFQNIFGYKTADIYSRKTKKLIFNNKFSINISMNPNDPRQRYRSFSLEAYNIQDRKKIIEILCLIFENKIEFNFDGKEPFL